MIWLRTWRKIRIGENAGADARRALAAARAAAAARFRDVEAALAATEAEGGDAELDAELEAKLGAAARAAEEASLSIFLNENHIDLSNYMYLSIDPNQSINESITQSMHAT